MQQFMVESKDPSLKTLLDSESILTVIENVVSLGQVFYCVAHNDMF